MSARPTFFPIGTRGAGKRAEYRIRILYREPSYARASGAEGRDFRWTYCIQANDAAQAKVMAEDEFREMERLSLVGRATSWRSS